jgi:ribosomal protein S12 methylthiotransferase
LAGRRFALDQHGCAKNQVDAEEIIARLEAEGWEWTEDPSLADLIIVNSCGFIEPAKKESLDAVFAIKASYPKARVMLAGCLAQRYSSELADSLPEADYLFGNADLSLVGRAAEAAMAGTGRALAPSPAPSLVQAERGRLLSAPGSAYLKLTEGCDNRCSYCAIPLIRGPLRSREPSAVIAEARALEARGIAEINLIGQDLGSYGKDSGGPGIVPLLRSMLDATERSWIRILYVHPDHFPEGLVELCADEPRLLPYFDVPFQHGSGKVLRAMGRKGDAESYLALIGRIRRALPRSAIRSTFLTGFPGEDEAAFEELLAFQREASLEWAGAFAYSREEGTPAYGYKPRVPKRLAEERKKRVEEAQGPISAMRLDRLVGTEAELLIEEAIAGEPLFLARSWAQAPEVDGLVVISSERRLEPGSIARGRIVRRNGIDLEARLVPEGAALA